MRRMSKAIINHCDTVPATLTNGSGESLGGSVDETGGRSAQGMLARIGLRSEMKPTSEKPNLYVLVECMFSPARGRLGMLPSMSPCAGNRCPRSVEHTYELQSLQCISHTAFGLKP